MRSTEIKQEMNYRLQMLADKSKQIDTLTYEKTIIEKDILNFYKERCNTEICNVVNLHAAWVDQPEPDPNRNYLEQTGDSEFERLMWLILRNIFGGIADEIKFKDKLCMIGYGTEAVQVPFTYKDRDFQLNIPNIPCLHTFDEFRWSGSYRILIREDKYAVVEIFGCYTADELYENIKSVLDKACEKDGK